LTLNCDEVLSSFAFNFNLCRHIEGDDAFAADMVYKVEQSARKGEGMEAGPSNPQLFTSALALVCGTQGPAARL
jgi:hypothetical protein